MTPTTTPNSNSEIGAEASKQWAGSNPSYPQPLDRPTATTSKTGPTTSPPTPNGSVTASRSPIPSPGAPAGDLLEAPALSVKRAGGANA
jgi:hypothetical protein